MPDEAGVHDEIEGESPVRVIAHVDMDAFFVAVEQKDDPSLIGKPVIVGGSVGNRGVVSAASYEARKFGVHSAMPISQARRLCPQAEFIPASHSKYSEASRRVMDLLRTFSPVLQVMSVDEAYLDLTGTERLHGTPFEAAAKIRRAMTERLGFSASIGIASNRLMAKIASELAKPAGILHVYLGREAALLAPLSIDALPGVGKVTSARLRGLGVRTVGDLASMPLSLLEANFKSMGADLYRKARGKTGAALVTERVQKSVGKETTFGTDQGDIGVLEGVLSRLAEQAAARLRRKGMAARGVTLKIRFEDFETHTRAAQLDAPTSVDRPIVDAARPLLGRVLKERSRGRKVRLLGVYLTGLAAAGEAQPELLGARERERDSRLMETLDAVRERFGEGAVVSGRSMGISKK